MMGVSFEDLVEIQRDCAAGGQFDPGELMAPDYRADPLSFLRSQSNAGLGLLARQFGIRGPAIHQIQRRAARRGRATSNNYIKWWETPLSPRSGLAAAPLLREVIADVRKVVRELIAEKDHRDNDRDRDDRNDECVFD